jgi:hypothetical protein
MLYRYVTQRKFHYPFIYIFFFSGVYVYTFLKWMSNVHLSRSQQFIQLVNYHVFGFRVGHRDICYTFAMADLYICERVSWQCRWVATRVVNLTRADPGGWSNCPPGFLTSAGCTVCTTGIRKCKVSPMLWQIWFKIRGALALVATTQPDRCRHRSSAEEQKRSLAFQ